DAAGVDLLSVGAHPGFASTNLGHNAAGLWRFGVRIAQVVAQPAEMGALPTLYAATAADVRGGEYFGPDGRGEQRGYPTRVAASTPSTVPETAITVAGMALPNSGTTTGPLTPNGALWMWPRVGWMPTQANAKPTWVPCALTCATARPVGSPTAGPPATGTSWS